MSNEAFDWLVVLCMLMGSIALAALACGIYEWVSEHRRVNRRLPAPEWRARVREPHKFSRWFV